MDVIFFRRVSDAGERNSEAVSSLLLTLDGGGNPRSRCQLDSSPWRMVWRFGLCRYCERSTGYLPKKGYICEREQNLSRCMARHQGPERQFYGATGSGLIGMSKLRLDCR
jgi:hypothetical protein